MEHGAIVMLRNVSKLQFGNQTLYQGLRIRPEPGGTEVDRQARSGANRKDATAEAFARLEQTDSRALPKLASRQYDAR
jgi:hypothetical protein